MAPCCRGAASLVTLEMRSPARPPGRVALCFALAFAAFAAFATSTASTASAQSLSGGFKGGFGRGAFTERQEFTWQTTAFSAIGFVNQRSSSWRSLQAELALAQTNGLSVTGGSTLRFKAVTAHLPLMLRAEPTRNMLVKPFVMGGPSLSYRLMCRYNFATGGFRSGTDCFTNGFADRMELGMAGGTGVSWRTLLGTLTVEGRGAFNLRGSEVPLPSSTSRSWSWSFAAGVAVPLHVKWSRPPMRPYRFDCILPDASPSVPAGPVGAPAASVAGSSRRISVYAQDADVRSLLIAIARESGTNLTVSGDVQRRVSVSLANAPVDEAIAAIVAQSGLSVSRPSSAPAVVFYKLAVNVNEAAAETIAVHFSTSCELARWLVETRAPQPSKP